MKLPTHLGVVAALSLCIPAHSAETLSLSRQELPADQNAYTLWTNALPLLRLPDDKALHDAFDLAWNLKTNMPIGETRRRLDAWLQSKKHPMSLISKGIALGQLQFPPFGPEDFAHFDIAGPRLAARMKTIVARECVERGDAISAAEEFAEVLSMGQLLAAGDGAVIHYLLGVGIQSWGLSGLRWLTSRTDVPPNVLRLVLAKLPVPRTSDPVLARVYQVEFARVTIPAIRNITSSPTNNYPLPITNAFDAADTIRLSEMFLSRLSTNALLAWTNRDTRIEADAKALSNMDGVTDGDREDFAWLLMMSSPDKHNTANREKWERVEALCRRHTNILGKCLTSMIIPSTDALHERSVRCRTEVSLTRAFVSLQLVQKNTGGLPESLEDVRRKALLLDLPTDFFSGKPVLYSHEKGIVWSVGPDGIDDGGDAKKDFVLRLPEESPTTQSQNRPRW